VQLSPTEFTVLRALMHTAGDLVSRETLETMLPRRTEGSGSKVLDVHVANLRRKLARVAPNATIRVTRGAGYALQFGVPDVTS
jgi:DNA-binding response OmpR family regulator